MAEPQGNLDYNFDGCNHGLHIGDILFAGRSGPELGGAPDPGARRMTGFGG